MIGIVKVISTAYDKLKRLEVKALFMGGVTDGKGDTRTPLEASPHGIDSRPFPDKRALYTTTTTIGKYYVLGYIGANRIAEVGATRLYATDADGTFKFNVWLRADGTLLMGTSDVPTDYQNFGVKYNELKQEADKLKATVDSLVTKWNKLVTDYAPGSPSTTGSPTSLIGQNVTANSSDFSLIKNSAVKTN